MTRHLEHVQQLPPKRLWFGFAGAVAAWISLGIIDLLLAWQACQGSNHGWGVLSKGGVVTLYVIVTALLLTTSILAGLIAFRNWQSTATDPSLRDAQAAEREEFMGFTGLFVAVSMVVGIIWLGLPFTVIDICARAR